MVEPRIEQELTDFLRSKEIVSEQRELMKMNSESIDAIMEEKGLDRYSFTMPSGLIVKVSRKETEKSKLDKGAIALELDVEKKELDSRGMVRLAEEDILKERHIVENTYKEKRVEIKIKAKKPKEKE